MLNHPAFWQRDDLLEKYNLTADLPTLDQIREERLGWLDRQCWAEALMTIEKLPFPVEPDELSIELSGDYVSIENAAGKGLSPQSVQEVIAAAKLLHPWRKGPFQLFGTRIESEWRSNQKWDRVSNALGDLKGKRVLDVGCGNGYYMFRMAQQEPRFVYGIDPSVAFLLQFELMQKFTRINNLQYDMLGFEHLGFFEKTFDLAVCMGIVYHHRSPLKVLRNLMATLRVGGECLVESQTIPGDDSVALFPEDRYAKARNVYFVPTASCLMNWMKRAGFKDVKLVSHAPVTTEEQRRTEWMTFESLEDFLDAQDQSKTIEGYPAPWRTAVMGTRAN